MYSIDFNSVFWCKLCQRLEQCSCTSDPNNPCFNCGCHQAKAKVRNIFGYMHEEDDPSGSVK